MARDNPKRRVHIEMDVPQSLSERAGGVVEAVVEKDLDILYRGDLSLHARCIEPASADTDHVTEARRMAMRAIEDWRRLSDEERHGTLHQIVDQLSKAESDR